MKNYISVIPFLLLLTGCATAVAVVDTAATVGAAAVRVGVTVVETAVDVTSAGVKAVTGSGKEEAPASK